MAKGPRAPLPDYLAVKDNSLAVHYLFECGIKLRMTPATIAAAAIIFHRFYREIGGEAAAKEKCDCYEIASACLCVAGTLKNESPKRQDVLNVSYKALCRNAAQVNSNDEPGPSTSGTFPAPRKFPISTTELEYMVLKTLSFKCELPPHHSFLLHFLMGIKEVVPEDEWKAVPLARSAMAFLQDFHHSPDILDYKPSHVAIACISLAIDCLGVNIPLFNAMDPNTPWFSGITNDLTNDKKWEITEKIMKVYKKKGNEAN